MEKEKRRNKEIWCIVHFLIFYSKDVVLLINDICKLWFFLWILFFGYRRIKHSSALVFSHLMYNWHLEIMPGKTDPFVVSENIVSSDITQTKISQLCVQHFQINPNPTFSTGPFRALTEKLDRTQQNNILFLKMAKAVLRNKLEKDRNYLENKEWREGSHLAPSNLHKLMLIWRRKKAVLEWISKHLASSLAHLLTKLIQYIELKGNIWT